MLVIEKRIRQGIPQRGSKPYGQIHAHSTGNKKSTVDNEANYMNTKDLQLGYFTHVVGNGRIIQTANVNQGAWDVGGGWNNWTYAAVELIESHKTKDEFLRDYKIFVQLLRQLAKEGNIPVQVDAGNTGILSHDYCTKNQPNNKSDHVDPYPYLASWGISKAQFKKDVENGISGEVATATPTPTKPVESSKPTESSKPATGRIATIQTWLNSAYKANLAVDNSAGPLTKKAIVKYLQREINSLYKTKLAEDGSFGPQCQSTWRALKYGGSGNIVKLSQAMLYVKGYDPNGFDGSFGPGMKAAVFKFQGDSKLVQDYSLGPVTATKLFN